MQWSKTFIECLGPSCALLENDAERMLAFLSVLASLLPSFEVVEVLN